PTRPRTDEMVQLRAPRSTAGTARRGAHVQEEHGLTAHAHGPSIARLTAASRVEISAQVDEAVRSEVGGEPIGEPALGDTAEIDRGILPQTCGTSAELEYLWEGWGIDRVQFAVAAERFEVAPQEGHSRAGRPGIPTPNVLGTNHVGAPESTDPVDPGQSCPARTQASGVTRVSRTAFQPSGILWTLSCTPEN